MALGVAAGVVTGSAQAQAPASPTSTSPAAQDPADSAVRVAVLPIDVEGELSGSDRALLGRELVEGLRRGSFGVVAPEHVSDCAERAERCSDAGCYRRSAEQCGTSHIVRTVLRARDRDYVARIELIDGGTGSVVATSEQGCEICGVVDVGELLATAAATLRTKLDALAIGAPKLELSSSPSGALVTIDGELVGRTPLVYRTTPGKRVVRVNKEGYVAVEREVRTVAGVAEKLSFDLDRVPSRLPKRPWGWASLGVGIGGLGVATAFAVLDDRPYKVRGACSGSNIDPQGNCRKLWSTQWLVLGTSLAAAALVTMGVAVVVSSPRIDDRAGSKPRKQKPARIRVGPGSLGVYGRF